MVKAVAMTPLLYGRDFLASAIRSVIDAVDVYQVIYSPEGSHGHRADAPCPESEEELFNIANEAAKGKLKWYRGHFAHEGIQRDMIFQLAPDADVILAVDSDEVYADGLAADAIAFAQIAGVRNIRLPFLHLWRSFHRGFAHDPAYPIRVICPKIATGETTMPTDKRVWHFGYAQRSEIVAYKVQVHGHRGEWRKDVDWLNNVFFANRQYDCHPVGSDAWNCEDIDQSQLPSVLLNHPYRFMGVIE